MYREHSRMIQNIVFQTQISCQIQGALAALDTGVRVLGLQGYVKISRAHGELVRNIDQWTVGRFSFASA